MNINIHNCMNTQTYKPDGVWCVDLQIMLSKNECGRSSHQRCSINKGYLKNFTKFTEEHRRQSLFFDKFAG